MKKLILLSILVHSTFLFSQENEVCAFDQLHTSKKTQKSEKLISEHLRTSSKNSVSHNNRIIPVVVHIIHNGGTENISQAQIESQIQILNEDYGKKVGTNGDGKGVDTRIQFSLAKIDPNGNCTNGIVRIKSELTNHQSYQRGLLKELSFWDNKKYLNMYIVRTINGSVGGYSSFAGAPDEEDGMVIRNNLFGNIGTANGGVGRTTTHEVGHWLGLYHTFNNGCGTDPCSDGDYVCDTPPVDAPNYGCPTGVNSCSNDNPDLPDLIENYMDYSNGTCQNTFTAGQRERMDASLTLFRSQIWSDSNLIATGCDTGYSAPISCPVVADFVCLTTEICEGGTVYLMDKSLNGATNWTWTNSGGSPNSSAIQNPFFTFDSAGDFTIKLIASNSSSADTMERVAYIKVRKAETGRSLPLIENFESGDYPPNNVRIVNYDEGITWELDTNAAYSGKYSIKINNLINTNYGTTDELVFPSLNLSTAHPDSSIYLKYYWAYAKSDPTFSDEMIVLLSTDCGLTYTTIFYKTQNQLATAPVQTTPFIPNSSQWRKAEINLNSYRNESNVLIKIVNVTDGGNNLYIDEIQVSDSKNTPSSVSRRNEMSNLNIFPNPSSGEISIQLEQQYQGKIEIELIGLNGQVINSWKVVKSQDTQNIPVSLEGIAPGSYLIRVSTNDKITFKKLIVL